MAVLGRLLVSSAERLDLPDLLSIDSYTAGDFKYLLKGLVGDSRPYILKGFDVKINYLLEIIIRYLVLGCLKHLIHHL